MQDARKMHDERTQLLARRHNFEAWQNRGTAGVVTELSLEPKDLAGWQSRRESRNDTMEPPVKKAILSRGDSVDELVGVELYRCASLADAHKFLLELLGSFQSDALKEQPTVGIGDVAFGISDPTMLVFARANYVVHVYNAGPKITNVMETAKAIDQKIARAAG